MAIDHQNAKEISAILKQHPLIQSIFPTTTNIVIAQTKKQDGALEMVEWLKERGIMCFPFGPDKIRFVFHLDINDEKMNQLKSVLLP
jgi:threonine aldolase